MTSSRRQFLLATPFLATLALAALIAGAVCAAESRPNILFAIADDWGWPDRSDIKIVVSSGTQELSMRTQSLSGTFFRSGASPRRAQTKDFATEGRQKPATFGGPHILWSHGERPATKRAILAVENLCARNRLATGRFGRTHTCDLER